MPTATERGLDIVKRFEALRLRAYLCPAGVPTIGYGHTAGVKIGDTCSREQAEEWLAEDFEAARVAVRRLVTVKLTAAMEAALTSFVFNSGPGSPDSTGDFDSSTLLRLLNERDYEGAAAQFDRWVYSRGKKLRGLVARREVERQLFLSDGVPT